MKLGLELRQSHVPTLSQLSSEKGESTMYTLLVTKLFGGVGDELWAWFSVFVWYNMHLDTLAHFIHFSTASKFEFNLVLNLFILY